MTGLLPFPTAHDPEAAGRLARGQAGRTADDLRAWSRPGAPAGRRVRWTVHRTSGSAYAPGFGAAGTLTRITVRFFAGAAEAFGSPRTEVEGVTNLAGLVARLGQGNERLHEILDQCSFFVDGEHHRSPETNLIDGSQVDVLPPFAGG